MILWFIFIYVFSIKAFFKLSVFFFNLFYYYLLFFSIFGFCFFFVQLFGFYLAFPFINIDYQDFILRLFSLLSFVIFYFIFKFSISMLSLFSLSKVFIVFQIFLLTFFHSLRVFKACRIRNKQIIFLHFLHLFTN